jgi:tetratricopeptide (TPR) repeat protein
MNSPWYRGIGPARLESLAGPALAVIMLISALVPAPVEAQPTMPDRAIQLQQRRLQRNPYDAASYHRLGEAYIQKGRESGDMSYFDLAEQALRKSIDLAPTNAGAVRHLAFVFSSRHDFEQAVVQATRALDLDPSDGDAYGVLGDALLELGKYEEADAAFRRMLEVKRDLSSYARRSGLETLRGDPDRSIADLTRAIEVGRANGQPRESIAWAEWQLGEEYFAVGDLKAAESSYRRSGATYEGYYRAFSGLARVRAAQSRYQEAIDLYRKAMAVIPLPEYAVALGDLYTKIARSADAKQQYALVEYMARLNALNRTLYNRELVYFYADHGVKLPEALELARREIEVRKDIYGYDALAWALYRSGRADDAYASMKEALRLGTRDAKLFYHAGMIAAGLGKTAEAITYLERALATNSHFHVLQADVARATLDELRSSTRSAGGEKDRDG